MSQYLIGWAAMDRATQGCRALAHTILGFSISRLTGKEKLLLEFRNLVQAPHDLHVFRGVKGDHTHC